MTLTTKSMRVALDIDLLLPKDASEMIALADKIEDFVEDLVGVKEVEWTECTAGDPDFDYGDWSSLMSEGRRAAG